MGSQAVLKEVGKSTTKRPKIIFRRGASLITGLQIRLGRQALGWSAHRLANESGINYGVIQRGEASGQVPDMLARNLAQIQSTLERAGIVFIDAGDYSGRGGQGVRLRK